MTLATLRARHFANNVFDRSRFAQTVTIKDADDNEYEIAAIVRRKEELRWNEAGQTHVLQTAVVTCLQADLPEKPDLDWRCYVPGDAKASMYACDGTVDDLTYTLTFERIKYLAS